MKSWPVLVLPDVGQVVNSRTLEGLCRADVHAEVAKYAKAPVYDRAFLGSNWLLRRTPSCRRLGSRPVNRWRQVDHGDRSGWTNDFAQAATYALVVQKPEETPVAFRQFHDLCWVVQCHPMRIHKVLEARGQSAHVTPYRFHGTYVLRLLFFAQPYHPMATSITESRRPAKARYITQPQPTSMALLSLKRG